MARKSLPSLLSHPTLKWGLLLACCAAAGVTAKEPAAPTDAAAASKPSPKPPSKAAAVSVNGKPVDRNEVLSLYMEGEFETLVALLENIRRERQLRDREDSVFIYKFLGVIYGADERTKRKAESFLYQMLELDPNEDLTALGVGESVQRIFERVRSRVKVDSASHPAGHTTAGHGVAAQPGPPTVAPPPAAPPAAATPVSRTAAAAQPAAGERKIPTWVWYASGGAAAAVVLGVIVLNQDPTPHVHAISDSLQ